MLGFRLFFIGIIVTALAGGGYYVMKLQKDNAILKANAIKLESAISEQKTLIENQKKDFEAILSANKEMNELMNKLKTDFAELDKRFNALSRSLKDDALYAHLPTLLRYGDRNSMAHSLEVRLPFCDHRIAEFTLSLNPKLLMGNIETKHLLRQSMSGVLPDQIKTRWNKQGFLPPQEEWLRGGLMSLISDVIGQRQFSERGYWETSWWEKTLKRFKAGESHLASPLWKLFISEMWRIYFVDRLKLERKLINASSLF